MRLRYWCFPVLVLQSCLVFADTALVPRAIARDGSTLAAAPIAPAGDVDAIVRFRDTPLFARDRFRLSATAGERAAALQSFDARFAAFERDLASLERARGKVASHAAGSAVRARFARTFAGVAVTVSADTLAGIARLDYVRSVHLDRPVQMHLANSVPKIRAPQVWSTYGTRGRDIVVAIIDTGIDYTHPALGGGFGPGHRVIGGYDFINNDADPLDDAGHGTHVAGIVGGNGAGLVGVAPEVSFLAYKVLDAQGNGTDSTILAAIERAADPNGDGDPSDRADVANMSLGRPGTPDDPASQAIEVATRAGVVFCISTGNAGRFQAISTPANAPSALSVGATTINDAIADFSSKGPSDRTYAIKPEVVAPGVAIASAKMGGGTVAYNGTSMAAPHVAGLAALLRALHPQWGPEDVKGAIVGTAQALDEDVMAQGAGRIDALRAAGADVIASPSTIAFGFDDVAQARWSVAKTFTVVNRGASTRALTLSAPAPRAHVTATLSATSVTLAPGESREITLAIEVDNGKVDSPRTGSLAIAGAVTIAGGAMPVRVPWAFVKAAVVTVEYDGDEPFIAVVASTDSPAHAYAAVGPMERRTTLVVPPGEYDVNVTIVPFGGTGPWSRRFVLVERRSITNAATIPIHRDMAAHEIVLSAQDERGRPLDDLSRGNATCSYDLAMVWPEGSAMGLSTFPKYVGESYRVSAVSDRFTLLPFQMCADHGNNATYSAQFEPVRGLAAPVTRTLAAADWSRNPLRIAVPPEAENPALRLSPGWMRHGANWSEVTHFSRPLPAGAGTWTGTAFLTRALHPSFKSMMFVMMDMDVPEDGPPAPRPRVIGLETLPIFRDDARTRVWRYLTSGPTTYHAGDGEVLPAGEGLIHPQSHIVRDGGGQLLTTTYFHGPLGEMLQAESIGADLVLRDAGGAVVQSAKIFIPSIALPDGAYTFELTKPTLRAVAAFDTRKDDGAPPAMTALRLLDGTGRVASRLDTGEAGALLVSAIDRVPLERGSARAAIAAEATRVRWRPHGTSEWHDLALTIVGHEIANGQSEIDALGHIPAGTAYRAELLAVTQAGPGLIDLDLHFEDPAGNTYDYTMTRAFSVGGAKRRNVRH